MLLFAGVQSVQAHITNHAQYRVYQVKNNWILDITFNTGKIHSEIISYHPELKGKALNSEDFKNAVFKYIQSRLELSTERQDANLVPVRASFGGHQSTLLFEIKGLSQDHQKITAKNTCFIPGEGHLSNEFIYIKDGQEYSQVMDEDLTLTSFNMKTLSFDMKKSSGGIHTFPLYYIIGLAGLSAVAIMFIKLITK